MFRHRPRFRGHRSEQSMNLTSIYTSTLPVPVAFFPPMLKSLLSLESNMICKMSGSPASSSCDICLIPSSIYLLKL